MRLLVLGGTKFLGRAIVDAALGCAHEVTLFNRGLTNPDLYPGLETVRGDRRAGGLAALAGRSFDAVIDVAGQTPEDVGPAIEVLHGAVERYVFVSTVSVYADHRGAQPEGDPVLEWREGLDAGTAYGAGKAAAERLVTAAFGVAAFIPRPGLIVGPHDQTDRFSYWPRRIARGGTVLAPPREHPVQYIDVRDLAAWIVLGVERDLAGIFNATGATGTLGELIDTCLDVVAPPSCTVRWTSDKQLLAAGLSPWMGIPLWIAGEGWEGAHQVTIEKAVAAGLTFRPLRETVRDTLAWDLGRGGPTDEGLSAVREEEVLASL